MIKKILYSLFIFTMCIKFSYGETISVIINGNIITKSEINNMAKIMLIDAKIPINNKNIKKFELIAQNEFINKYIKGRITKQNGVIIDDVILDRYIKSIAKQQKQSIDEYYTPYYRNKVPISLLSENKRIELTWKIYVQEILANSLLYAEEDLKKYIKDISGKKLRNISIIAINFKSDKKKAYQTIKDIQKQLENGKKFEQMAKNFSADISAFNNGNIGWISKGQQVKKIDLIAWGLPVGGISNPIKLNQSYVIIKVNAQRIENGKDKNKLQLEYLQKILYDAAKQKIEFERNNIEITYK